MPRISLSDVKSIGDLITADTFELLFGTVPVAGASKGLTLKCYSVMYPGFSNMAFDIRLAGHVVRQRGMKEYTRQLQVVFAEDSKTNTMNILRKWHEFVVGTDSGNSGGPKSEYAVDAQLNIYNQQGILADKITFRGVFPFQIPDISMQGDNSALMLVTADFSYDNFESDNVPIS